MELSVLLQDVISIAKSAGDFIRTEATGFNRSQIEYKGLNDMVSYVDKSAERMIVSGLGSLLPEAGFVTEEQTISKTGEVYNWIIDPLDGTTNFIHGIPTFSVSIALQQNQQLVLGVVYEINRDECFYAWKDGGAWLNGKRIQASPTQNIADTLLATGFPYYDFDKQAPYLAVFQELMQSCHGLRRIGSAAVDMAYVACGRFDGYFEYNLNAYDVAAGVVLVNEAGGKVTDFAGDTDYLSKREMVATNGKISDAIIEKLNKHFGRS